MVRRLSALARPGVSSASARKSSVEDDHEVVRIGEDATAGLTGAVEWNVLR